MLSGGLNISILKEKKNLTHSPGLCWKGVFLLLLTDETTLRHSHISGDQSQSSAGLHQPSDGYLDPLPPHFVHDSFVLMRSYARESAVYFTPRSTARSERLSASDRVFCVGGQNVLFVWTSTGFEAFASDRHPPAHNESDSFWQVERTIPAVTGACNSPTVWIDKKGTRCI